MNSPKELLTSILRDVSRSFYLTLRVLPGKVRPQIGLAYLLARMTDTVADTGVLPVSERLESLRALQDRINDSSQRPLNFGLLAGHQSSEGERVLLKKAEEILKLLQETNEWDRREIVRVLAIITGGQADDLRRFSGASREEIRSLESEHELDAYTYQVAGCVGEFWTRLCRKHLFPHAALDETCLFQRAIRFGKGLQLVNILRDLPSDLRNGRCYIPSAQLRLAGLTPIELLVSGNFDRFRPIYQEWVDRAEAHLREGWKYTNSLPYSQMRIRLACAWPVLIGFSTLKLLRSGNPLNAECRIKISRSDVRRILVRTVLLYPVPSLWKGLAPEARP